MDEIAGLYARRTKVYLAEVDVAGVSLRPGVLVTAKSFWTLRIRGHEGRPGELANLVWPATRALETSEIEARGRKRLRKAFSPLGRG